MFLAVVITYFMQMIIETPLVRIYEYLRKRDCELKTDVIDENFNELIVKVKSNSKRIINC